jgi:hypothetical protein
LSETSDAINRQLAEETRGASWINWFRSHHSRWSPNMNTQSKWLAAPFLGLALSLGSICIVAVSGCTALTEKSPREALTDAEIVTRAKALLAADPVVKARNIHITAVRGDVTLSGVVKSEDEARRAAELIRPIPGVRTVMTALKVET